VLRDVSQATPRIVETVAHTESAVKYYGDPHVIVDVGGQDIKLIVLKNGASRISARTRNAPPETATSCSQPRRASAFRCRSSPIAPSRHRDAALRLRLRRLHAVRHRQLPASGWAAEEILAGLAAVLPKNIFLYVASIPNLAKLGRSSCSRAAHSTTWRR
jgi:hypothetical protein